MDPESRPPVVIKDYDPQWPVMYEEMRSRLLSLLGPRVVRIEHVGSTSVPGLGAKPVIDMMLGVEDLTSADQCLEIMKLEMGVFDFNAEPENDEWFYCVGDKTSQDLRNRYHLHLVKYPSPFWDKHIRFRDILRSHAGVADAYCRLKKDLAKKYGTDRMGYNQAKTEFIETTIASHP